MWNPGRQVDDKQSFSASHLGYPALWISHLYWSLCLPWGITSVILTQYRKNFLQIDIHQSNHLWGPCRLSSDKFLVKFSYKTLLNSTSILWWPPERPEHPYKMGLCHPKKCSLCLWVTSLPWGPSQTQAAPDPCPQTRNSCLAYINIFN